MNDFFANLFEILYYKSPFSEDMYRNFLYAWPGVFLLLIPFVTMLVFYKFLDHPRYHTIKHWFIAVFLCCLIDGAVCLLFLSARLGSLGLEYSSEKYWFVLINVVCSMFVFFLLSFMGQRLSQNASETPFALKKLIGRK